MHKVFIGGCPRSGTTFLASLLSASPHCRTAPESWFKFALLNPGALTGSDIDALRSDFTFNLWSIPHFPSTLSPGMPRREVFDRILECFIDDGPTQEPRYYVDHTPANIRHVERLSKTYADARFIHIIRDGRAVYASVRDLTWGPRDPISAARWWERNITAGLAAALHTGDRMKTVRYEELVSKPAQVVEGICTWLGIPFEPEMLAGDGSFVPEYTRSQHQLVGRPASTDTVDRWRSRLTPLEVAAFEVEAGSVLESLGYTLERSDVKVPLWRRWGWWLTARARKPADRRRFRQKRESFTRR